MSYELNDEQVGILEEVLRDRTQKNSKASEYLCINVDRVVALRFCIESSDDDDDAKDQVAVLQNAIQSAMEEYSSMFIYLRRVVPGFEDMHIGHQHAYAEMARNAWLQRMIETRKIA